MSTKIKPVVVAAMRTPQGKRNGMFSSTRGEDLSIEIINEVLQTTEVEPKEVDDLVWGCALQRGEQDNNIARIIGLMSSLGESVPATTVNRWCASSMQAIMTGSDAISAGQRECVIAGGVEHMTRVPMDEASSFTKIHPEFMQKYNIFELQMGMTAEAVAGEFNISRMDQDLYALRSHEGANSATKSGKFKEEIVPIEVEGEIKDEDEGIRENTSIEKLEKLQPVFRGDGTVTAGNSSQISDGAAVVMITSDSFAKERGLEILAAIDGHTVVGVDPRLMGVGPIPATQKLLSRVDKQIGDIDLVELNEA
ncbi:MAG TPA: thiolase family protein, partial [Halobacteriales archaeon]|nr:thiolase family protein [Halobacteriales archaeon]